MLNMNLAKSSRNVLTIGKLKFNGPLWAMHLIECGRCAFLVGKMNFLHLQLCKQEDVLSSGSVSNTGKVKQALRNSCELLRRRKEAYETACKLMELHVSLLNFIKVQGTACKLIILHEFFNILH